MVVRKERIHHTGNSNRTKDLTQELTCHSASTANGPIDFDTSLRATKPGKMDCKVEPHVPLAPSGSGHNDFHATLAGHDFRQPKSDPREAHRLKKELERTLMDTAAREAEKPPGKIVAVDAVGNRLDDEPYKPREARQKGHKAAPRWNPARWYEAPPEEQAPLQKDEGHTWNHMESQKIQGHLKAQDRLMRTVGRREDVATPESEAGGRHPMKYDYEEYYPGRSLIDAESEEPGNDFQIRPINLPDFYIKPSGGADSVARMQRLREVIKQRYAGRPKLIGVFRSCALQKPGFVFPKDLQQVFDQMGIKVEENECDMLIKAVDKDQKGAVTFEEFSDLIYGPRVNVGGGAHEPQERHVRHVTKTLVDNLTNNGQALGKAFCELDPERHYAVTKAQFANALSTACNHISKQGIDFLWASQFEGEDGSNIDNRCIDWQNFMSQLAHFQHDNRAPTPCCLQGRKRQYDLLQRSAAITGGYLGDVDLNRPVHNPADEVQLVADKLIQRQMELPTKPRDAALLTEPYVDEIRSKAIRAERALPKRISKARMRELLKDREMVHQDELAEVLCKELDGPMSQQPLAPQEPIYASMMPERMGQADIMILDPQTSGKAQGQVQVVEAGKANSAADYPPPAYLKLVPADIQAYMATQRTNRDHEINVEQFIENVYKPEDDRKVIDSVNDGLNRHIRGHRPPRERPPNSEVPRHENYWQARYIMELLADNIAMVEKSNGGKLKPSKIFKRLDMDNDGYISLSDLRSACEKYGVPNSSADLHAFFSELDKGDKGSVQIGEFTRQFDLHQGCLLDNMSRPIKAVHHEGGVQYGGPIQESIDARERELAALQATDTAAHEATSSRGRASSAPVSANTHEGTARSQGSQRPAASTTQLPLITEVNIGRPGRVSDVIRARTSQWKPQKHEIFTAPTRTRFGLTVYPDTRHVTEPSVPLSASFLPDRERFKTMNTVHSLFAVPDPRLPQAEDSMKNHARNEFRVERIQQRQRDFAERTWAANQAAQEFDEMKIARKALNQINYERRCKMSCA